MKRKRTWKVRIRNMVYTNDDGMRDIFFQFCFGHDLKLYRIRKTVKGGSKADKYKRNVCNSTSAVWDWVEKGSRGYMHTSEVHYNIDKGDTVNFKDEFVFTWKGSYFDLYTSLYGSKCGTIIASLPTSFSRPQAIH